MACDNPGGGARFLVGFPVGDQDQVATVVAEADTIVAEAEQAPCPSGAAPAARRVLRGGHAVDRTQPDRTPARLQELSNVGGER
jgi:hypothetical protein